MVIWRAAAWTNWWITCLTKVLSFFLLISYSQKKVYINYQNVLLWKMAEINESQTFATWPKTEIDS